jgi:hypothetical protein
MAPGTTMKFVNTNTRMLAAALAILLSPAAWGQSAQTAPTNNSTSAFELAATVQWLDTNLDLRAGEKLRFTATGNVHYPADKKHPDGKTFGPEGLERSYEDLIHQYAVTDAGHGALIARLGTSDFGQPFLVGASKEYEAPVARRLFIGINQSLTDASAATGKFQVKIEVLDPGLSTAAATAAGGPPDGPIPFITPALLAKIPRRISDADGKPGDMVNILIVGTEDDVVEVFTTAGWVKVDSSVQNTVANAIIDSLEKKDYLTMPMSTLYLFTRPQDYGFAHPSAWPCRAIICACGSRLTKWRAGRSGASLRLMISGSSATSATTASLIRLIQPLMANGNM